MTQLAYLDEPLKLEFEAEIVHKTDLAGGQIGVILKKTYFYPTGGGQTHDTGMLGQGRVVDVFKDQEGNVLHTVDRDISGPIVAAKIDYERRLGNMQHHSGQHILSQAIEEVLGLETISAKISAATPATIDVPAAKISPTDLERVESLANSILFENRAIKSYFITEAEVKTTPFRRPPAVKGQIRVVEIEAFDYSACGGTHCPMTGMVGLIKILKTERTRGKIRVYFIAGQQALSYFQNYHNLVTNISRHFNTSPGEVLRVVDQQTEQLRLAQKELKRLRVEILPFEAQKFVREAEKAGPYKLVLAIFKERSLDDIRALANILRGKEGVIALLAGYDGRKLSLIVSCADDTDLSAKELLAKQLRQIGGRGGGSPKLAQGGGEASEEQVETFFAATKDYITSAASNKVNRNFGSG